MAQLIFTDAALRRADEVMERHPELRDRRATAQDLDLIRGSGETSIELFATACERYGDRTCFASGTSTITYGKVWERVCALARGLKRERVVQSGDRVGLCGVAGIDWVVADLACLYAGLVSVPIATNLPPDELRSLVEHARLRAIVAGGAQVSTIARSLAPSSARPTIVVMRNNADDDASVGGAGALDIAELEAAGLSDRAPFAASDGDRLVTIMYTSGSTNRPKGVMLTERRWRSQLHTALGWPPFPFVFPGYLPHSQIAGRRLVFEAMMHGGFTHFTAKSLPFDELPSIGPTLVPLPPRLAGMIQQQFQSEAIARHGADLDVDDPRSQDILHEMRSMVLGDRLCLLRVGSAAIAPSVVTFLERCFGIFVAIGYGTTETGSITVNGSVLPQVEYKLADVPELGYAAADRPYPRGEFLVRSVENTIGYFDDPAATASLFDADGFVKTGDVVEERAPGVFVWIDRRSSVVKLAQGQFVAPSRLEDLFAGTSSLIEQMYIHAESSHAFLLAVLVPSDIAIRTFGAEPAEPLRRALREDLDRIARTAGLRNHEVPRDFLIERARFTQANHLLTELGKPNLRRLREHYGARLAELHSMIEARQLSGGGVAAAGDTVPAKLRAALGVALGLRVEDLDAASQEMSFVGYGGDSVSALRLCALIEEAIGVQLSVASVLDPSASLRALEQRLSALVEGARSTLSFTDVHGDARRVQARELESLAFTGAPASLPGRAADPPGTVLLTGATGFLGRFLMLELAERLPRSGQVICVARGGDDRATFDRLYAVLAAGGGGLAERFAQLVAEGRVVVRSGDLMRPALGLAPPVFDELCERVDAVVHGAALVNHAISYQHLFEPNVLGTRELARLAARRPGLAMHFVSSIGVATRPEPGAPVAETETARTLWPNRATGGGPTDHAVGYVTSKWAGEVLLEQLHERHGTPVAIYRCSNLAPHPDYPGHLNWADNTNRLLYSLTMTRCAPASFYAVPSLPVRYELVPVDLAAAAIAANATRARHGFETFHVSNAELEPVVSLDALLGWIESAGISLTRLPHAAWFPAFRDQLERLPDARRARSSLPALGRWEAPIRREQVGAIETSRCRREVKELLGRELAPVDEALVHRWLRALTTAD